MIVKFNIPYLTGQEQIYVNDAIQIKKKIGGDGHYTKLVSEFIENKFDVKKALMMTSCSSALDVACLTIKLGANDEVIMPSYNFVSAANSVVLRGAKCVFAEIDDTLNIDLDDVESKITKNTRAVIPVHYAGSSCDMDRLMKMSKKYGFCVIEDAAQAVNGKYKDRYLGTIGDFGCFSFHETKNYTCGEGGALLINDTDEEFSNRAEITREKGTNRSQFFRGEVDKYSWKSVGSSYLPSDILCAYLLAQFEKLDEINQLRCKVYNRYFESLKKLEEKGVLKTPLVPEYNKINYHMFYILLKSHKMRDDLLKYLNDNGVNSVFHHLPLHTSNMGVEMGYTNRDLPKSIEASNQILRLPMYTDMTDKDVDYVVGNIVDFFKK